MVLLLAKEYTWTKYGGSCLSSQHWIATSSLPVWATELYIVSEQTNNATKQNKTIHMLAWLFLAFQLWQIWRWAEPLCAVIGILSAKSPLNKPWMTLLSLEEPKPKKSDGSTWRIFLLHLGIILTWEGGWNWIRNKNSNDIRNRYFSQNKRFF